MRKDTVTTVVMIAGSRDVARSLAMVGVFVSMKSCGWAEADGTLRTDRQVGGTGREEDSSREPSTSQSRFHVQSEKQLLAAALHG